MYIHIYRFYIFENSGSICIDKYFIYDDQLRPLLIMIYKNDRKAYKALIVELFYADSVFIGHNERNSVNTCRKERG